MKEFMNSEGSVRVVQPLRGGPMWILSKHLKKSGLSHAQLESLVSQRTIALQNQGICFEGVGRFVTFDDLSLGINHSAISGLVDL
jgi:hypothetical protein